MKKIIVCTVLMGLAGIAAAADDKAASEAAAQQKALIFPQGWYFAPMLSYTRADAVRGTKSNGYGAALALGNRSDIAAIELAALYTRLPSSSGSAAQIAGGELSLMVGPFFEQEILSRFFGIVSFGVVSEKDVPAEKQSSSNIIGDAGIGYMQPVTWFGWKWNIRSEIRYRYDYQQPPQPAGSPSNFKDWVFNVGLQIPFTQPAEPVPPPPAVTVVPASTPEAPPAPAAEPAKPAEAAPAPAPAEAAPINIETAKAGDTIVLSGVTFNTGKSTLTANAKTILDGVAKQLMSRPALKVEIGGHTDSQGRPESNQKLAERRAESVRNYLIEQGLSPDQLTAVGYGQDVPVDTNDTPEGRERNRRVEMKVLQ
jgi:outer membrane protein OmpA-like peptidoglycan-associated protein